MLAITMGDPNGVGPEILLKAYSKSFILGEFVVIGDKTALEYCSEVLGFEISFNFIESPLEYKPNTLNVISPNILNEKDLAPGKINKKCGYAAINYVSIAVQYALDGLVEGIVTLPISKQAVQLSYPKFSGHTEFIAQMCNETNYTMMLSSSKLLVTHVNTHVSMKEAIANITKEKVFNVIQITNQELSSFINKPKIAVAGLNCHASENGLFGNEEIDEIIPAIEMAKKVGIDCSGPYPPDTVFVKAINGEFDVVVCMYHDQGHIPIKLLGFDEGVNTTLGLKIKRTSVDHGTAYDIAYKGIASITSFVEAYNFARKII